MPEPDAFSDIMTALQRGILLRRENPTYRYWPPVAEARRGFKMVLFTASRGNNFVGGPCALPSALLVNKKGGKIKTKGQSNLTKNASRGAHSPVRGHPRGSKVVPLNFWGRVSY